MWVLTFREIDLFDGANLAIAFDVFHAFDWWKHELGADIVGVKD